MRDFGEENKMVRATKEDLKATIEGLGYEFIKEYNDNSSRKRVIIKDLDGYKYDTSFYQLNKGTMPNFIGKHNVFSLENMSLWLKINNKNFKLCENNNYRESNEKLFFQCLNKNCSEVFDASWDSIRSGNNCPYCSVRRIGNKNNLSYLRPDLVLDWDYEKNNGIPENTALKSIKVVFWVCSVCEYEWKASPQSRSNGSGCPSCSGRVVNDKNRFSALYPEIASEWHPVKNGNLTPHDIAYGSGKKVWWLCHQCGHEWECSLNNRTGSMRGCPNCNQSKGERRIYLWLDSHKEKFKKLNIKSIILQKTFSDCKNKKELPFDFGIEFTNGWAVIEYHGEQHYRVVDFFGGENGFNERVKRDKIKEKYCIDNNIPLLIIPYWEFDNIEKILDKNLL